MTNFSSRIYCTMQPKKASKEEEKMNKLLERKESDLTRLTAAKSKLEGQQRHWEGKKEA